MFYMSFFFLQPITLYFQNDFKVYKLNFLESYTKGRLYF